MVWTTLLKDIHIQVGDCVVVPRGNWNGTQGGDLPRDLSVSEVPEYTTLADYFWYVSANASCVRTIFMVYRFGKIIYIDQRLKTLHVQWFEHSSKTYLGKISDPQELFLCPLCGTIDLKVVPVLGKLTVHNPRPPRELAPLEFFYQCVSLLYQSV